MYSFDSRVRYSETAEDGRLSLCSAIHYMQDCSIFQSEALGVGIRVLREQGRAWLLSSWQVEFLGRPELGEKITVGTWASSFKAMYGYRNFVILDGEGRQAVRAATIWVYMDIRSGHPAKAEGAGVTPYPLEPPIEMEQDGRKIRIPEGLVEYDSFPVQKYQIDTNGHVNNGQYIQMAEPWLPEDENVRKLRVEYKKAAVYGDRIVPFAGGAEERQTVVLKSPDGQVYAIIQTVPFMGQKGSLC